MPIAVSVFAFAVLVGLRRVGSRGDGCLGNKTAREIQYYNRPEEEDVHEEAEREGCEGEWAGVG